ncbi:b149.10 [miniopterid betaherpesvirus 1]|uniref:B149.10 n=1 Tax=miniopterid betaherpesvirus 1 TaxID=3070189 RepID=I3VQE3_9BETA|nr:b149.10 [miniopterid betaherpesvirus 1]AFK83987.1 b149.10 [miniopterid betaherpesvirus 1]
MLTHRELRACVMSLCAWQLLIQSTSGNTVCSHKNYTSFDVGEPVTFSCDDGQSLSLYSCYDRRMKTITGSGSIGNTSVTRSEKKIESAVFDHTLIGWSACTSQNTCKRLVYIVGRHMVAAKYARYGGMDIFTCETPVPELVRLEMYVDGVSVTHRCFKYGNGSIGYIARLIRTAMCAAYLPCLGLSVPGTTFNLHQGGFNLARLNGHWDCYKNGVGKTSLRLIQNDVGGILSDRDNVTTPWDRSNVPVVCGWCVKIADEIIHISDVFRMNIFLGVHTHDTCTIAEYLDWSTGTFIPDVQTSHASATRGLGYLLIVMLYILLI